MKFKNYTSALCLLFLFAANSLKAQLLINEFSASNAKAVADEYGHYGDWIEFYNNSSSALNLYKYKLSDDPLIPAKWQFPKVSVPAHGFLTVFADDTNKYTLIDHWETAVKANDTWSYKTANSSTDTNWRNPSFNDAAWNRGKGGFGYGDGDDSTVISNIRTLYIRKKFTITDTSQITKAILNIDYDDGFAAFLNGVEIARKNLGILGWRPLYDDFAASEHEAKMYQGQAPDSFYIDFNLLRSAIRNGSNVLAIEVHNLSDFSSDLSLIPFFTLGVTRTNYVFPAPPVWFKASPREYLHANFKLSKTGETIVLSDSSGNVLDQKYTGNMPVDVSYGRSSNGASTWCWFSPPTPSASNNTSTCYSGFSNPPNFSIAAGFYPGPKLLSLSTSPANAVIRYTTDGNTPTLSSPIYVSSLSIDTSQTIKAKAYAPGLVPSDVVTNTYFIDEDFHLPVFSVCTDSNNLWDDSTGIYVLGNHASTTYPYKGANYWQDWEKAVSVEYYDKQKNRAFQFDAGFKINGNYSRTKPQKSFEFVLDNNYGLESLDYPLIEEKTNISSYDGFILRNAGTDWNVVHYRDGLMQRIMKNTHTGYLGYEPCELFLNGRYWGVYEIRDNDNHSYVKNNFGYKKSEIDLLFEGGGIKIKDGSDTGFYNMYNYAITANPVDSSFYAKMNSMFDMDNYMDYFIAETYYVNNDWIGDWSNNIKLWRPHTPGGKWKYILYDLDFGMGLYSSYSYDKLADLIAPNSFSFQTDIFNAVTANPKFRNNFINRYADLINTIYVPANVNKVAYAMRDSIAADMPLQFARWGSSMSTWAQNIATLVNFSNKRPAKALNFIQSNFNLTSQVILTLQAYPAGAGRIQISTIVPDSLPWKGTYFNGNPVTVTAIPNPGYSFDHWKPSTNISLNDSTQSITLNFASNDSVIAYFVGSPITPHVTISEINYQSADSADAGDWVEFYNPDSVEVDLTDWKFRDNNDNHTFTFPLGTKIKAKSYLVLAEDLVKFRTQFPAEGNTNSNFSEGNLSVEQVIGPMDFAFSNAGELLRLYNYKDSLQVSMSYSNLPPWPSTAAGLGYTLESIINNSDLENGDNWFAGCLGGSPGSFYMPASATILNDSIVFVCQGSFNVLNAQVGDHFSYQWYKNGVALIDSTHSTLNVLDSGAYTLQVKRFGCEAISNPLIVKAQTLPLAHLNTNSQLSICAGSSFNLQADSSIGQTFEWYKNDSLIPFETHTQYSVSDSGNYAVKVTQNGCSALSSVVHVNNIALPYANLQGDSAYEFCEGNTQQLTANVVNGYTYAWYKNDTLILGADSTEYYAASSGNYVFETTFTGCSMRSPIVHVLVNAAPKTFVNVADTLVLCVGESKVLEAFADSNYSYQWYKNDTLIAGADSASLFIEEEANYKLITSNGICSATAELAVLVHPSPLAVIIADSLIEICAGTSYQLKSNKSIGYTYQWLKNNTPIVGANTFKYAASDSGYYAVQINLNSCVNTSNQIHVVLHNLAPSFIYTDDSTTFCQGNSVELKSHFIFGNNYQWYRNGASLANQTDSSLMVSQSGNYTLVQSDSLCNNLSNVISVLVKALPLAHITPNASTHLCFGSAVILSCDSAANYSFEWYKNNSLLTATGAQLSVSDSGYYAVKVTNDGCTALSDSIVVYQNQILSASILALDTVKVCSGSSYLFVSDALQGLNYQWLFNGTAIPFASDTAFEATANGAYSISISDAFCAYTSTTKVLENFATTLVSLASFSSVCPNDSAFALSGGMPMGGSYSGNGISLNTFYPANAALGFNSVNYTYIDSNQCASSATSIIEIKSSVSTPVITQNFNQLVSSAVAGNQWFYNNVLIPGATQQTFTPSQNGHYSVVVSDSILCNSDSANFTYLSVGISQNSKENVFLVYPNPSNGEFFVQVPGAKNENVALLITTVLGEVILVETGSAAQFAMHKISLQNGASGIYLLRIKSGDLHFEEKLIIH